MAKLPPDSQWLVQMVGLEVIVFQPGSEDEIVRFLVTDIDSVCRAQAVIAESDRLTVEQRSFAHFWCGYFYAHVASL